MGVYIKGMEMPKECRSCQMMAYHVNTGKTWCTPVDRILADKYKTISFDGRPNWCPLIEVKEPHGDLIDKEVIKQDLSDFYSGIVTARRLIDAQDVVIEAEGETT